jgi:IS5 family transposase
MLEKKGILCTIAATKTASEEETQMLRTMNTQLELGFQASNLKITNEYFERYERISRILDENPKIIKLVHRDLKKVLTAKERYGPGRNSKCASDTILRIILCMIIEGLSFRAVVIRVDDSKYLRYFVRIYGGEMIGYSRLNTLANAISAKTWKKINWALAQSGVNAGLIDGGRLRLDTTGSETNIHWPTDSGLLWDTYRVLCRLVNTAREIDPEAASDRRLQPKRVKRLHTKIARRSARKQNVSEEARGLYNSLLQHVEGILGWVLVVCDRLRTGLAEDAYDVRDAMIAEAVITQIEHFHALGLKVADQGRRRVINDEKVPNEEKLFSIFEPHTELLKRGKAGKPIEFGHMIAIQQVENKFITDYEVFERKPVDYTLVDPALESHRELFGKNPGEFSADKGFYESMEKIRQLEEEIEVVSIGKKGKRNEEETERETSASFKRGQQYRAGVEGTISFLKRGLGMARCLRKGWKHYVASVGAIVFAHNLLVLAAGYG